MLKLAAALVGLIFVLLVVMMRKNPGIALGLVWCLYAMEQVLQAGLPFFVAHGSLINLSIFGVSCIAFTMVIIRTKMLGGIRFPRPVIWMLFLFGLMTISTVWAPKPGNSLNRLKEAAPYIAQFIFIAPICAVDRNQLDKAIKVLIYFGFFVLVGLSLCPIINRGIVLDDGGAHGQRIDANPLAVAGFAGYVILAAVFKVYGMKKKQGRVFLAHVAIIILGLLVMARSGSRGQVVACIISLVVWLPVTARVAAKRSSILAMVAVLLVAIGLYYFVSNGADAARWQSHQLQDHAVGRLDSAFRLLQIWRDAGPVYWVVGLGTSAAWDTIGGYPHIVPLEVIAEEGLLGFVFFSAFCLTVVSGSYSVIRRDGLDAASRVNLGLVVAMFTFQFALSFKQGSLVGSQPLFCFGLTAAWYVSRLKREERNNYNKRMLPLMQDPYYSGAVVHR